MEIRSFDERFVTSANGASIAVADWPGSLGPLVCVHGLTSNSRAFAGLATELPHHRIVAIDCRGRGQSGATPPFGLEQHAADLAAVLDHAGIQRATVVGHSMGTYVAGAFSHRYPERVERLVYIDGGYPPELPAAHNPDDILDGVLGIFLTKLQRTWRSFDEYLEFYENTPLYPYGLDLYGRTHFAYDLEGTPPWLGVRVVEEAIRADWRDLLDSNTVGKRLEAIGVPLLLLRAPGGLTGAGDEVVPDEIRTTITGKVPTAHVVDVPGTNHHTILLSVPGARAVARAIEEFLR